MKTTLDCLPCLLKQTLQTARLATDDPTLQKEILDTIAHLLPTLDFELSPPENSVLVYDTIASHSGCNDPFYGLKKTSNRLGRSLRQQVLGIIEESDDPLYTACLYAVAGNIIDYGSIHEFNAEDVIHSCQQQQFRLNDYGKFRAELDNSSTLLYLGDNSGEIVFDSLVVGQLQKLFPKLEITFVVKQRPIINDALMEDALACGLPQICTVIDNGTGCPGAPLQQCSSEFREYFAKADMIISKGQGNFETLSEQKGLYFLLICKCAIVGQHLQGLSGSDIELGDLIFFKG
ncbi:MAG: ARMT1-like domain-containing protein [Desulfobulbaceae bacterium]|jgi:uncharacterized protein with ATP-grasp and redox domains|nr:ARMT1-like domain-containing protein [Desulfobulbaceae bacterium]